MIFKKIFFQFVCVLVWGFFCFLPQVVNILCSNAFVDPAVIPSMASKPRWLSRCGSHKYSSVFLTGFVFRFLKFCFLFDLELILFDFILIMFPQLLDTRETGLLYDIYCLFPKTRVIKPLVYQAGTLGSASPLRVVRLLSETESFSIVCSLPLFDLCFCQITN